MITEKDILDFQDKWGGGIVRISNSFKNNGDYLSESRDFLNDLYAYDFEEVLFKPTLASNAQFRLDKQAALSYFVGNNPKFSEDKGFAIKGWNSVKWKNAGMKIVNDIAICMGNYYFGKEDELDLKVEYSIVLRKINGVLKIILHDSHLPYQIDE